MHRRSAFSHLPPRALLLFDSLYAAGAIRAPRYFMWSLRWASENSGMASSLKTAFQRFDKTNDGQLDLREVYRPYTQELEHRATPTARLIPCA